MDSAGGAEAPKAPPLNPPLIGGELYKFIFSGLALPHSAMGLSAVCDCDISLSYSFTIFIFLMNCIYCTV